MSDWVLRMGGHPETWIHPWLLQWQPKRDPTRRGDEEAALQTAAKSPFSPSLKKVSPFEVLARGTPSACIKHA